MPTDGAANRPPRRRRIVTTVDDGVQGLHVWRHHDELRVVPREFKIINGKVAVRIVPRH